MMSKIFTLVFFFSLQLAFAQEADWSKIDGQLSQQISDAPAEFVSFYIVLKDRLDILEIKDRFDQEGTNLQDRSYELITQLQSKAANTQSDLLQFLQNNNQVETNAIKSYWISNMIYVRAKAELIAQLSRRADVALLESVLESELVDYEELNKAATVEPNGSEDGLRAINAHKLWELGYTGYGQIALILDTGTDASHPALRNNYRGLYFDKSESYNGVGDAPSDCNGHGTHVAGTICGIDRSKRDTIGVAFNALWTSGPVNLIGGCEEIVSDFDNFQWALDPDGDPSTIDDQPAAINNSWGSNNQNCNNNGGLADALNALEAVGIAVVWAAGNNGSGASSITTQGNLNNGLVNSFSVGALNGNNPDYPIAGFSSRGPSTCEGSGSLQIKPEVSAPGVSVRSAYPDNRYRFLQGTSMAAPHVAGAITLLKEAFPYLTGETLKLALYFSATDLGAPGEDNDYGMGMINLWSAYNYLINLGHTPVDPKRAHDVILVDFEVEHLFCQDNTTWTLEFENGGTADLNNVSLEYRIWYNEDQIERSGTLDWTGSLATGERGSIDFPDLAGLEGIYDFEIVLGGPNGLLDERPFNNRLVKKQIYLFDPEPLMLSVTGAGLGNPCVGSNAIINIEEPNVVSVDWYAGAIGGISIGTNLFYETPPLPVPFTFYADPVFESHGGIASRGNSTSQLDDQPEGLVFDVYQTLLLKSVKLYSEQVGPQHIIIEDREGNTLYSNIFNVNSTGAFVANLNVELSQGDAYRIFLQNSNGLYYETQANFPYRIGHNLSIRESTSASNPQGTYYYFYDWVVEHRYICGRPSITVQFENEDGPSAAFNASTTIVNDDQPGPVQFTNETLNATQYLWDFGDGTSSTEENPSHQFSTPGTYLVRLTAANEVGCAETATLIIEVEEFTVSTLNLDLTNQILIYPNPNRGIVQVAITAAVNETMEVQLMDLMGRPLLTKTFSGSTASPLEFNLKALPNGLYQLVVKGENQKVVKKLIKMD